MSIHRRQAIGLAILFTLALIAWLPVAWVAYRFAPLDCAELLLDQLACVPASHRQAAIQAGGGVVAWALAMGLIFRNWGKK